MQRTGAGREMVIKPVQFGNTATLITHMQLCYQSKHERQSLILGMKLNLGVILPIEVDLRRASVEIEPELSEVKRDAFRGLEVEVEIQLHSNQHSASFLLPGPQKSLLK